MTLEEVVARVLREPLERIDDATGRETLRSWNSLCHVELILALEDAFAVKFTRREVARLTNVALLRAALREKGANV